MGQRQFPSLGDQVAGQINGSLDFDGGDDYVSTPSIFGAVTQLSFSVWAKEKVGTTGNRGIMGNYKGSTPYFVLQYETNSGTRNININWLGV